MDFLVIAFLLLVGLKIADWLLLQRRLRRARRHRLMARISEIARDARRQAERPTLNTRSDAP